MPVERIAHKTLKHDILIFAVADDPDVVGAWRQWLGHKPQGGVDVALLEGPLFQLHLPR